MSDQPDALLAEVTALRAERDALRAALSDAESYLAMVLEPCEPDCDCLLHSIRAALAQADAAPDGTA